MRFFAPLISLTLCVLAACGSAASKASRQPQSVATAERTAPRHVGFVAFDGTGAVPEANDIVYQFLQSSPAADKRYFAGTNFFANDFESILKAAVKYVCSVHDVKPFDALGILGYSRGGVAALVLAVRLQTECKTPVPVRWLGLLDTVATNVEPSLAVGNSGRDSLSTRCVHLVKTHESRPLLDTAPVLSCERHEIEGNHTDIAESAVSLATLRADAFSVMPELVAAADAAAFPALNEDTQSCRMNDGVPSCLRAGCTWTNARCEPVLR